MNKYDVWCLSAETHINGERRGFSWKIKARPARNGLSVPPLVQEACAALLSDVIADSDVHTYDAVLAGKRFDHPYRYVSYHLQRNGETVVRSFGVRPVKPEVIMNKEGAL
jgi:hypothetical protein